MASLAEVLEWKYGPVANTKQKDPNDMSPNPEMIISGWRHKTIPKPNTDQIAIDFAEYEAFQASKKQKQDDLINAKQSIKEKHIGKKSNQLTDADVIEWMKYKMTEELNLDL